MAAYNGYPSSNQSCSSAQPYYAAFPRSTSPEVIRSFQADHQDRVDPSTRELQSALSSVYLGFGFHAIRLLLFLFRNPHRPWDQIGKESIDALLYFWEISFRCWFVLPY